MTTKREQVLDQLLTVLAGTSNVGTRIYRSRAVALQRAETPALVVEWSTDTPDRTTSARVLDWVLSVSISVVCRGDKPDEIADPIIESLHSKIMSDTTLNGYAFDIETGAQSLQLVDADQPAGVVECVYLIRYRTYETDLTQAP